MRRLITLLLTAMLLTTGCIPYSETPLTEPDSKTMDRTLFGTWYWKDANETGFVHIGLNDKTGMLHVVVVDLDSDGEIDVSELSGHTSQLESNTYLNLHWLRPDQDENAGYLLVKYRAEKDTLGIALMNAERVENAIEKHELQGTVSRNSWGGASVRITNGQPGLQAFVTRNDGQLFPEMNTLKRLIAP